MGRGEVGARGATWRRGFTVNGRFTRRLASPRLAAWLIAALMALTVVNVLIPQRTYFSAADFARFESQDPGLARVLAALGLDAVFGGWLIAVIAIVLCVNVLACTWQRIRTRARSGARVPVRTERMPLRGPVNDRHAAEVDALCERLHSDGWRVRRLPDGVDATRPSIGFWGSVVLHLSIVVIAVGGAFVPFTSFSGSMVLTEGQTVLDQRESYLAVTREPSLGPAYTGSQLTSGQTRIGYQQGSVITAEVDLSALTPDGSTVARTVSVNHPLDASGKSYLLQDTGVAADLVIQDVTGRSALVVNLAEMTERGHSDAMTLSGESDAPVRLWLTVTPVPLREGEVAPTEILSLDDPRLEVREGSADGALLAVLAAGQDADLGDGVSVGFTGPRYWNTFMVRSAPARLAVYAGFLLAVLGSVLRFVFADRRVGMRVRAAEGGSSEVVIAYAARPWGVWYAGDRGMIREHADTMAQGGAS